MFRRSVLLREQILTNGDQIAPGIGLVCELSGLVPLAPVLAATADIGVTHDRARIDQGQGAAREIWSKRRRAVRTISRDERRGTAVELESFPVAQAIRNLHAVFGDRKETFRLVTAHIDGGLWRNAGVGEFASGIDRPNAGGREPTGEKDKRAIFIRGREYFADGAIKWQCDVSDMALPIHPAQSVDATIHHFEIETVLRPLNLIDD